MNSSQRSDSAQADSGMSHPRVRLPREAAARLNISTSMLRRLTLAGEIGHVRLGAGTERHRIGYTDEQLEDFIASRSIPPAPRPDDGAQAGLPVGKRHRANGSKGAASPVAAANRVLDVALATGAVKEWRPGR